MIVELHIKNIAVIEELRLEFTPGLNIITGETGAGKSIIINSLNLLLGEKVSTDIIRTNATKSVIEGIINIENLKSVKDFFYSCGIEPTDEIIIKREITKEGKNRCFINNSPVTLSKLKELGDLLVDIHGQHEHQSLFNIQRQIDILDEFGKLTDLKNEYIAVFRQYQSLHEQLKRLMVDEHQKKSRVSFLNFIIEEIERADLKKGEDIELQEEFKVLSNKETLFQTIQDISNQLYEDEHSAISIMGQVLKKLTTIAEFDKKFLPLINQIKDGYIAIKTAIDEIISYKNSIDFSEERLEYVIQRLDLITRLKKKYGNSIDEILAYKERCVQELNNIMFSEIEIDKLNKKLAVTEERLKELALTLSQQRKTKSEELKRYIIAELASLNMPNSNFEVRISYTESDTGEISIDSKRYRLTEQGLDNLEFLISVNVGEDLRPLRKVASGGELSRIMLGLKNILNDNIPTLIFDEVDSGIGAGVAEVVGKKLKNIAKNRQVICITHLPGIACFADTHFVVRKTQKMGRTYTDVYKLKKEERVLEIARMLAGEKITDTTIKQAKELIGVDF